MALSRVRKYLRAERYIGSFTAAGQFSRRRFVAYIGIGAEPLRHSRACPAICGKFKCTARAESGRNEASKFMFHLRLFAQSIIGKKLKWVIVIFTSYLKY